MYTKLFILIVKDVKMNQINSNVWTISKFDISLYLKEFRFKTIQISRLEIFTQTEICSLQYLFRDKKLCSFCEMYKKMYLYKKKKLLLYYQES